MKNPFSSIHNFIHWATPAHTPRRAPRFAELTREEKRRVGSLISRRLGAQARGGYRVVFGPDQLNRKWISPETQGELAQVPIAERNRLVAAARQACRENEHLEGVLHQLDLNVVGCDGGKAVFAFPEKFAAQGESVKKEFIRWAQAAEYFDDLSLQKLLRLVLRTLFVGGDLVLVYDWDLTAANSGQVIMFEPDCVGNLTKPDFAKAFPEGFSQHDGIVKDADGKTVGVIVSWSQRGESTYQLTINNRRAAWTLLKPRETAWKDSLFTIVRGLNRVNQMRGSSRLWPALGTVADMADLQGFELQAAKKNAQLIATLTQSEEDANAQVDADLDPDALAPVAGIDDALTDSAAAEVDTREPVEVDNIKSAGVIFDMLPPGVKMELLNATHPNEKLVEFSRWLHGGVAFALGLGNVHATGKADASYSATQAEILLSNLEFSDEFHRLETDVLDWVFSNWSRRAQALGLIPQDSALPPDWRRTCVKWLHPAGRAVNPVDEQNALNSGLKNGTILLRDKMGPDWKSRVDEWAEEIAYCRERGVPHLSLETVSGQLIDTQKKDEPQQ